MKFNRIFPTFPILPRFPPLPTVPSRPHLPKKSGVSRLFDADRRSFLNEFPCVDAEKFLFEALSLLLLLTKLRTSTRCLHGPMHEVGSSTRFASSRSFSLYITPSGESRLFDADRRNFLNEFPCVVIEKIIPRTARLSVPPALGENNPALAKFAKFVSFAFKKRGLAMMPAPQLSSTFSSGRFQSLSRA